VNDPPPQVVLRINREMASIEGSHTLCTLENPKVSIIYCSG